MNICLHCDEDIVIPIFDENDNDKKAPFCCNGCLTVFKIIHLKGLDSYYEIKNESAIFKRRSPVEGKSYQFNYLDNEEFIKDYTYLNLRGELTIEFYLEGIHCLACLWLIEKLPEFLADVKFSRLDMNRSVATISLQRSGKLSHVARELNNLGHKPHPLKRNQDTQDFKTREDRKMLLKIGIAAAGAGNIMLYAVSIYAGASGAYASLFNKLSVAFAIPVLFYSATPFYWAAWNALKNKTLSIDIPISMALLIGAVLGIYNMIIGVNENFFDSLTTLVFLLLLSRYFLNKIQKEGLTASDLNFFYQGNAILKKTGETFIETHLQQIKENDIIKVLSNQMLPVDGVIIEGTTSLNNSLLTGESRPELAEKGTQVFSGTMNLGTEIIIRVEKTNQETRIGKILKQVESGWIQKAHIVDLTNRISKYFLMAVFFLATLLFANFAIKGQALSGLERAITLLIVTCPCALALATPLTLTRTLSRAQKKGIIIKNDEVIEKLSKINSVFLDKTGTITYGFLKVDDFKIHENSTINLMDVIVSLEKLSLHPAAIALVEYAKKNGGLKIYDVQNLEESLGVGVSGTIEGFFYEIRAGKIFENQRCLADFSFNDLIRPDSKQAVDLIKSYGIDVSLISGDQKSIVMNIAEQAGINHKNVYFEISPEKKLAMIETNNKALMVGDGANDAMALDRSYVGVAVMGAMDISMRAADIYLSTPGITPLADLIIISKETMKVIRRNLILSLLYNSLSVYAAFTGMISPLLAAVIMPLSSLTVLASTFMGTKKLNTRLNI